MEVGDEQIVTTDALPPQDVPATTSAPEQEDNGGLCDANFILQIFRFVAFSFNL
jgi:hypothetical protein